MKSERISKYYKFLQAVAKKEKLTSKEFMALVKEHKCSTSIGTILCNGGVMKRKSRVYYWVSPVCSIDTTVKALENLNKYNKLSKKRIFENNKAMNPKEIEPFLIDHRQHSGYSPKEPEEPKWERIFKKIEPETYPKEPEEPKWERPVVENRPAENRLKSKITWFMGLYSKTEWYAPT